MKTSMIFMLFMTAAALPAQDAGVLVFNGQRVVVPDMMQQFQEVRTMAAGPGWVEQIVTPGSPAARQTVTGRPVSGTEEQKSTQTLGDGTVISNTTSNLFYRDSAGRIRVENDATGRIVIVDPVAHTRLTLNPETRKAIRITQINILSYNPKISPLSPVGSVIATTTSSTSRLLKGIKEDSAITKDEDLGVESMNGVLATHKRHSLTIPQGQIGNDRDIHVANERWYSDDLQMLVKTVNSDPRFGVSTYEFTNISREEPDPALFQIPADYTIVEGGSERGGKVVGPLLPATGK